MIFPFARRKRAGSRSSPRPSAPLLDDADELQRNRRRRRRPGGGPAAARVRRRRRRRLGAAAAAAAASAGTGTGSAPRPRYPDAPRQRSSRTSRSDGSTVAASSRAAGRSPRLIRRRRPAARPNPSATSSSPPAATTARPSTISSHGRGRGCVATEFSDCHRPGLIVGRHLHRHVQAAGRSAPCDSDTVSRIRNSGAVSSSWMKRRMSRYCPDRSSSSTACQACCRAPA